MNKYITSAESLVTSHEQTRAGFLSIALEKNFVSDPFVKTALAFKTIVKDVKSPEEFLTMPDIRPFLLTASGLSDKSMNYLTESDKTLAIKELIDKFLKPAGDAFIDETIYRYLLIKGDSVGGTMRNRIGALGEEKLIRCILSCLKVKGIKYTWMSSDREQWNKQPDNDAGLEKNIKAISWENAKGFRTLGFDLTIKTVSKNIDICLFDCGWTEYNKGKISLQSSKVLMLGELKGGIDPAGADEHWKTANTALSRIRKSYGDIGINMPTSFVGAAIESAMANEIFEQLSTGEMTNAANLTNNDQLVEYCEWVLKL